MWFAIGITILLILYSFFNNKKRDAEVKPITFEIQRAHTLSEMVASINYGRVFPYYIGMNFAEVKNSVGLLYPLSHSVEFKKALQNYELTAGINQYISLPIQNPYIDDVFLEFNENNVVSSITIVIKDFEKNATQLKELMCAKFGTHTPSNGRYIIWSDLRMVIRIDEIDGCIEVVYLKICRV